MEKFDFDKPVERRGTGALKYDALSERFGRADLIPLWVADMDFETPPFITQAIQERLAHSLYGYTVEPPAYWESVIKWTAKLHDWQVKKEWLSFIPGIVKGIGFVINVFTKPDEKVIIQSPVYHLFRMTIEANHRTVVDNPLRLNEQTRTYEMDLEHLESIIDERCRLLILCNPHNPVGITWDKATLIRLAEICARKGVLVISDEIHADMALWDNRHVPFATVSTAAEQNSVTFCAPTKTFNMAGIVSSYAIVPNEAIRQKFFSWLQANELHEPTLFAPIATIAAYTQGEAWRKAMLHYVEENIRFVTEYLRENLPQITVFRPQASFLLWLDCRALNLEQTELVHLFVHQARLALNDGAMFGDNGKGFMRMNMGCPRHTLQQALEQLRQAVQALSPTP